MTQTSLAKIQQSLRPICKLPMDMAVINIKDKRSARVAGKRTSAMPMLAVETAVGWKGVSAQLAAFSARSLDEPLGNSARTICVDARAIVQSACPKPTSHGSVSRHPRIARSEPQPWLLDSTPHLTHEHGAETCAGAVVN